MGINREEVLKKLEENQNIIHQYSVRRLGLFGSCARGDHTEASDLDFVVEFDKKTFDHYMELKAFLEKLFSCKVDLVLANTIKPRLRATILREAVHAPGL
jgi:predicted nucleotidyltransferase